MTETATPITALKESPWGPVVKSRELAPGIITVATNSHGGIWLSADRAEELVERAGSEVPNWLSSKIWWEEDQDVTVPLVLFADEIGLDDAEAVRAFFGWFGGRYQRKAAVEWYFSHAPADHAVKRLMTLSITLIGRDAELSDGQRTINAKVPA